VFDNVDAVRWHGPTEELEAWTKGAEEPRLLKRALRAADALG
jgi:hypothetical protein